MGRSKAENEMVYNAVVVFGRNVVSWVGDGEVAVETERDLETEREGHSRYFPPKFIVLSILI